MKLDAARLCLDCEEIHDDQICPSCSSEAFAFLTRWIEPASEPRVAARRQQRQQRRTVELAPADAEHVEAYRQLLSGETPPRRGGLVAKSLLGLAAMGLAGWAYRAARKEPSAGKDSEREEPRTKNDEYPSVEE